MQIKCGIKGVVVSVGSRQLIFFWLKKKDAAPVPESECQAWRVQWVQVSAGERLAGSRPNLASWL